MVLTVKINGKMIFIFHIQEMQGMTLVNFSGLFSQDLPSVVLSLILTFFPLSLSFHFIQFEKSYW